MADNLVEATVSWLEAESVLHSGAKFDLSGDERALREGGVLHGHWENRLYSNYVSRVGPYEAEGKWQLALQAAGKQANVARGLYVAIAALRSPVDITGWTNGDSFRLLRNDGGHGNSFDYSNVQAVEGTPFDNALHRLDASLPQPFELQKWESGEDSELWAEQVLIEGYRFFLDKVQRLGGLALPEPGLPSGEILPWSRAQEFVTETSAPIN